MSEEKKEETEKNMCKTKHWIHSSAKNSDNLKHTLEMSRPMIMQTIKTKRRKDDRETSVINLIIIISLTMMFTSHKYIYI